MMDNLQDIGETFDDWLMSFNTEPTPPIGADVPPVQRFHQGIYPRSRDRNQTNEKKLQRNDKSAWQSTNFQRNRTSANNNQRQFTNFQRNSTSANNFPNGSSYDSKFSKYSEKNGNNSSSEFRGKSKYGRQNRSRGNNASQIKCNRRNDETRNCRSHFDRNVNVKSEAESSDLDSDCNSVMSSVSSYKNHSLKTNYRFKRGDEHSNKNMYNTSQNEVHSREQSARPESRTKRMLHSRDQRSSRREHNVDSDCESILSSVSNYSARNLRSRLTDRTRKKCEVKYELADSRKNDNDRLREMPNYKSSLEGKSKTYKVGYMYLVELLKKEPHEILLEALQPNSKFDVFLQTQKIQADWLFLVMRIIAKIASSEFVGNKNEMFNYICKSSLLHTVSYYLGDVCVETNKKTISNMKTFFDDLLVFYSSIVYTLPTVAFEKEFKKLILKTTSAIEQANKLFALEVSDEVLQKLTTLISYLDEYDDLLKKKMPSKTTKSYRDWIEDMAPPEDFRELSLYPTFEDLTRNNLGFVRPNKVKGAYIDVEHYLDVQFRLLREDFIDPLRKGLKKYALAKLNHESGKRMKSKYESVRLYQKVKFEHSELTETNQVGYVLNFDVDKKMTKIKWEYCKRFMYGSLLLFTNDNFETFFCGTVLDRNMKKLTSGKILVALTSDIQVNQNFFNVTFCMAESEVFFEPYYLVMKSLILMNENNFPMSKYIVYGEHESVIPKYMYKFEVLSILGYSVEPVYSGLDSWPSAKDLGLDNYQYRAFKKALTSEFCVIQGPPGTGKTFLGLKIMEVLLKNIMHFNPGVVQSPILVVCYTNHALDQFLEGLIRLTTKIVRVGGQSKSEALKRFNLRGQNQISIRREARVLNKTQFAVKETMKLLLEEIHELSQMKKNLENPIGILKYKHISSSLNDFHKRYIVNDDELLKWLFNEDDDEDDLSELDEDSTRPSLPNFLVKNSPTLSDDCESQGVNSDINVDESDDDYGLIIDEEDIVDVKKMQNVDTCYCLTIQALGTQCNDFISLFNDLQKQNYSEDLDYETLVSKIHELRKKIRIATNRYYCLKKQLDNPEINEGKYKQFLLKDFRTLKLEQRWILYWYWIKMLRDQIIDELHATQEEYKYKCQQFEEYKQMEDLHVVRKANVVGMTTTGAARLRLLLSALQPTIVIVEEAAEVLEAHIVTSLTKNSNQVILIGDHKQLKPSSAAFELAKHYNLDISLFERMINNGMDCPTLNIQHRMRPEISCLISPLIYPDLRNHESVFMYESIRGVEKNVFFLEHNVYEEAVDDTSSRKNKFEAEFTLELCRYLILQGYDPSVITILTTYTGQMFLFREEKKKKYPLIKDVKCIVVDKYQGEENDIILLSLVRSNEEGKIGFLKTENRVCVALSRAKKGLYIVGNMNNLSENSSMWKEIKRILEERKSIGKVMKLYCDKHEKYTYVSKPTDFDQVREGGCSEYCGELMKCGHVCGNLCHTMDDEHLEINCRKPCMRTCARLHPCKRFCYEDCGKCNIVEEKTLICGHSHKLKCYIDTTTYLCDVILDDISPFCQHPVKRQCSQSVNDVLCMIPCEDRLDCGHACTQTCHKQKDPDHIEFKCQKPCEKKNKNCSRNHQCKKLCFQDCGLCTIPVKFQLSCGHEATHPCSVDLNRLKCYQKCRKTCPNCGLKCRKSCWEDCHPCTNKVEKQISECGHTVLVKCHVLPTRKDCTEMCDLNAPCGHKCKALCSKPCHLEKCLEIVKIPNVISLCGHNFVNVVCFKVAAFKNTDTEKENLLSNCDEPCNEILKCGDPCSGTCGQCWQGRLHKSCQNKCGNTLICGHSCSYPCRKVCPPCQQNCNFRCKHSKCSKKCGVPCVQCKEKCEWRCKHKACTRKCGQMCNREPCYEPCEKMLNCGHSCIGYCGEPCPPLCRICNPEVTEIMFGYEDEPDARFVYLEDCNHTIESQALDKHLLNRPEGGEIVMKVCPLCKTPITRTARYMNYVKETYSHIIKVKKKIFGDNKDILEKRRDLSKKLMKLKSEHLIYYILFTGMGDICCMVDDFLKVLAVTKRTTNTVSSSALFAINFFYDVFSRMIPCLKNLYAKNCLNNKTSIISNTADVSESSKIAKKISNNVHHLFKRMINISVNINKQQTEDISLEVERLQKMVDFNLVLHNPLYEANRCYAKVRAISDKIEQILFGHHRYIIDKNEEINQLFKDFEKELKSSHPLTKEEKEMIHEAMSVDFYGGIQSKGHWFTCTNGHYYCITECGGAMQESKCPECNEKIGGTDHRYVNTVRVASDMDGAQHPAWSPLADMRNFAL